MTSTRIARRLLGGTSAAALTLGVVVGAAHAQQLYETGSLPSGVSSGGIDYTYIYVENGTVTGNVQNDDAITPGWGGVGPDPNPYPDSTRAAGITVDDSKVSGNVANSGIGLMDIDAADAGIAADARAAGIRIVESDVDGNVINDGTATIDAAAAGTKIGNGIADDAEAFSRATGIWVDASDIGEDADGGSVINNAVLTVQALSEATRSGDGDTGKFMSAGASADGDAEAAAEARGIWIDNSDVGDGAGGGSVVNNGPATVIANADATRSGNGGAGELSAGGDADGSALALSGAAGIQITNSYVGEGEGGGSVENHDVLNVTSNAMANRSGNGGGATLGLGGDANGNADAEAEAAGISILNSRVGYGDGGGSVVNNGRATVTANATAIRSGNGGSAGGGAGGDADGDAHAHAGALGIDVYSSEIGNGNSGGSVTNNDILNVTSNATALRTGNGGDALGGSGGDADGHAIAETHAAGIGVEDSVVGYGDGGGSVSNNGPATVVANATAARSGDGGDSLFLAAGGSAEGDAAAGAEAVGIYIGHSEIGDGIAGGSVTNEDKLSVTANATAERSGDGGSGIAAAGGSANGSADALAAAGGIVIHDGSYVGYGDGGGSVLNNGPAIVTANATADRSGNGGSGAGALGGSADGDSHAHAIADGIYIGDSYIGDGLAGGSVLNTDALTVTANSTATRSGNGGSGAGAIGGSADGDALASAEAHGIFLGSTEVGNSDAGGNVRNTGRINVTSTALAERTGNGGSGVGAIGGDADGDAEAVAIAAGIVLTNGSYLGSGTDGLLGNVSNSDVLNVTASATANRSGDGGLAFLAFAGSADGDADAEAAAAGLSVDRGSSIGGTLSNSGTASITAAASATRTGLGEGNAWSDAFADGMLVERGGEVGGDIVNAAGATLSVLASAQSTTENNGEADAEALARGITVSRGGDVGGKIDNSGALNVEARTVATATEGATAEAESTAYGILIDKGGEVAGGAYNSGGIIVLADALATGSDATSRAYGFREITDTGSSLYNNDGGFLQVTSNATAISTLDFDAADAEAFAYGSRQTVEPEDGGSAIATMSNIGGIIVVEANGTATSAGDYADAWADATSYGVRQHVDTWGGTATAEIDNSGGGQISSKATATATTGDETEETGWRSDADADARSYGVRQRVNGDGALADVNNAGSKIVSAATATATSLEDDAEADARSHGVRQSVSSSDEAAVAGSASANVDNSAGLITSIASALATGEDEAGAYADSDGVRQSVDASVPGTSASVNNKAGRIASAASAVATAEDDDADAEANSYGVNQEVYGFLETDGLNASSSASVDNAGGVIDSAAFANSTSTDGEAHADVYAHGVHQHVDTYNQGGDSSIDATVFVSNAQGAINTAAFARASGEEDTGSYSDATGIYQEVSADAELASAEVDNTNGRIVSLSTAIADSTWDDADALSWSSGIYQAVDAYGGGNAEAIADNTGGAITSVAVGTATGEDNALAETRAGGIDQYLNWETESSFGDAYATAINASSIFAASFATATTVDWDAEAHAYAWGIAQGAVADGEATVASVDASNEGEIRVLAVSVATSQNDDADAQSEAWGIWQGVDANVTGDSVGLMTAFNAGLVEVTSLAVASGPDSEEAAASAFGARMEGSDGTRLVVDFQNIGGKYDVVATAIASDAEAEARGLAVRGSFVDESSVILNQGENCCDGVFVRAFAPEGEAEATGIDVLVAGFDSTIENNRANISAYAEGADAQAYGIRVRNAFWWGEGFGEDIDAAEGAIVNDGGGIWAATSSDGGETINRGVAISTAEAPNPFEISLMGDEHWGNIFGDILLSEDDAVIVSNGMTNFNGVVNAADNPVGSFTIESDGQLFLRLSDASTGQNDGASEINVANFTQEAGSDLWFEINTARNEPNNTATAGAGGNLIGRVNAENVSLGGDALIRVVTPQLFEDQERFENVVVANNSLTGGWDSLASWTPLLSVEEDRDGNAIHLDVTRNAFDAALANYTTNQYNVASAIEASYDDLLDGEFDEDYETLVGTLFTLNAPEYAEALKQLSPSIYAQGLWSVTGSLDLLQRAEHARMKGAPEVVLLTPEPQRDLKSGDVYQPGPVASGPAEGFTAWVAVPGAWGDVDGDDDAPGFNHDRWAVFGGADYRFNPNFTLGAIVGYYNADLKFADGSRFEYDGLQAGVYGKYERDQFYLNALAAGGWYSGSGSRSVTIGRIPDPMECGCLPGFGVSGYDGIAGINSGSFDATAYMLSAEAGYRIPVAAETTWFTPFLGLNSSWGHIRKFAETSTGTASGTGMRIGGTGHSFTTDLGVRVAHKFSVGEATNATIDGRLSWLHEFRDPNTIGASFLSTGSTFDVIGSVRSRDTIALDLGIAFDVGSAATLGISYQGRYNGDFTDHGVMGRFNYRFGQ